jgi:photosystem II stability/assembly factor-like uncharacterized protein
VDGNKLVALGNKGVIYSSTNSGLTWNTNNAPALYWTAAASSADGSKVYATSSQGEIWTLQTTPTPLLTATLSSGALTLSWTLPTMNFVLMQSSNLNPSSWVAVTNIPALNLDLLQYQVTLPATRARNFFRLASP